MTGTFDGSADRGLLHNHSLPVDTDDDHANRHSAAASQGDSANDTCSNEDDNGVVIDDDKGKPASKKVADDDDDVNPPVVSACRRCLKRLTAFYQRYDFLLLVLLAIVLAKAYPPLGAVYVAPQITATWLAVVVIFILSGLSLKTEEFKNAFKQIYFNLFVQLFSFGFVSAVVFGVTRGLAKGGILGQDLADGLAICGCLPMAINLVIVLTRAAGGDEAASIFNASFGNLVGSLLSPALILGYLGTQGNINIVDVFYKLALKVLLPIFVGQLLRNFVAPVREFAKRHKPVLGKLQQYCLIFIIYTTFCKTFLQGLGATISDIFVLVAFVFILLVGMMIVAWYSLKLLFPNEPKLRAMGLFGCSQKTVAAGVPLIGAMYESSPSLGLYTLPLIIWYTMQLLIGTMIVPALASFVQREEDRLGVTESSDDDDLDDSATIRDAEKGSVEIDSESACLVRESASAPELCAALSWAEKALAGEQTSDTDGERLAVSISELDASSVASSSGRGDKEVAQ